MTKNALRYIVIKDKMFVYLVARFDKENNTAHLTLYKNPDDYRAGKVFDEIEVTGWR